MDRQGNIRTDTDQILVDLVTKEASLLPVGDYKGYGWALLVELLSSAIQSGPFGSELSGVDPETGEKKSMPLGHFFLAVDLESMVDLDVFKGNVVRVLDAARSGALNPKGEGRIFTPNQKEFETRQRRETEGGLMVSKILQQQMMEVRSKHDSLQEKYPQFPFETEVEEEKSG